MSIDWLGIETKELTALGGTGIALALVLVLGLLLLLPRAERRFVRMPVGFLAAHLLVVALRETAPHEASLQGPLEVLGLVLLLISLGRSSFLLFMHALLVRRLTRPVPRIFRDLVQALVYVAVALITLRAAGVDPGSLLTTSALLTAVIGLSLQDTLGNMFAGLAIQAERPFETGDWIQFDENPEHVGKVLEMNWRAIKLLTLERVEVTVPNAALAKAPIRNYTKPLSVVRRDTFVFVPFDVPPQRIHALLTEAVRSVTGVLPAPPPTVLTNRFTERGAELWIRYFIDDFSQREIVESQVLDRVWYVLNREGIEIPPPARTVRLVQASDEDEHREQQSGIEDRLNTLQHVDFLAALPDKARRSLAAAARCRLYANGEAIIEHGQTGSQFFVIVHGEVMVLAPSGTRVTEVARLRPYDFFGEMSFMTGEPRRATVRAITETQVLVIERDALASELEASPRLAEIISRVITEREKHLEARLAADASQKQSGLDHHSGELLHRIRKFFSI